MKLNDPKRIKSAYDYVIAEEGEFASLKNWNYYSYSDHRLNDPINAKEYEFYFKWQKIAANTLAYLLSEKINAPDYENISQRDLEVSMTLIQWLGSNCGQAFLRDCGFMPEGE